MHGSEGMQCSWFPQKLLPSSPHPSLGAGAEGPQGMGQPGDTEGLPHG